MKETIIRTVVALLVAIFDLLKLFGIDFGIDSDALYGAVSLIVGAWIWWKNNSFTQEARLADNFLKEMKLNKHLGTEAEEPEDAQEDLL